jgi:hypothetical protein
MADFWFSMTNLITLVTGYFLSSKPYYLISRLGFLIMLREGFILS